MVIIKDLQRLKSCSGLSESVLGDIIRRLSACLQVEKVILFGSRATGEYKEVSDIDLAVMGSSLTGTDTALLRDTLQHQVSTPLKIDLLHLEKVQKPPLLEQIEKKGIVIYER